MFTLDYCLRCDRQATTLDYCEMHYQEFLREWACPSCGDINNAVFTICRCGQKLEEL